MSKKYSRRGFLGLSGCAAMGYTSLFSSLINLKALNAAAMSNLPITAGGNYKALICLYQMGGNDSFNMLVPKGNTEYNEYANVRSNLALAQEDILGFDNALADGRLLGVHPSMPEVRQMYNQGKLAFVSNIGTLIAPSTPTQFWNNQGSFPVGLFSHSDQIQQWQTAQLLDRSARGWGGKVADLIHDMNSNDRISMNISLSGSNVFQTGEFTSEFVIDPRDGSAGIFGYEEGDDWNFYAAQTNGIDNMLDQEYADIFKKTYIDTIKNSVDANREFGAALEGADTFATVFTDNDISKSFEMIAKIISTRETLGFERQIFFVNFGGWDHHDELLINQVNKLAVVSKALGEFNTVLEEMNMSDCVTTFTVSEFGRTLTSNGNGTDHAWGGNVMVMGGAVNGSNVFGNFPALALNGPQNVGDGALMPTTAVDQYLAELALWFGVSPNDLSTLFPNLSNFYSIGSGDMPIGFLNV